MHYIVLIISAKLANCIPKARNNSWQKYFSDVKLRVTSTSKVFCVCTWYTYKLIAPGSWAQVLISVPIAVRVLQYFPRALFIFLRLGSLNLQYLIYLFGKPSWNLFLEVQFTIPWFLYTFKANTDICIINDGRNQAKKLPENINI